ncbi:MAG: hypothetical protein JWP16_161 [Alphaproteobacteria bacterium]|nr:hypothetical protein [Alphaproteobacteria bacterium]
MTAIHVVRREAVRYTARMETPVLTAALARKPRRNPRAIHSAQGGGESKTRPHNYVAEPAKKRAGAALGNRHAATGAGQRADRHRRLDALIQLTSTLADTMNTAAYVAQLEQRCLIALLAEAPHG